MTNVDPVERSLLGAVMIDGGLLTRLDGLRPDDFGSEAHGAIFTAIRGLADRGDGVDLVTVRSELEKTGRLERAGGDAYLSGLVDRVPDVENVKTYAGLVREASQGRRLLAVLDEQRRALVGGACVEDVRANVARVLKMLGAPPKVPAADFAPMTAEDFLRRHFPPRMNVLSPWLSEKSLSMLFARRGAGKTWLAESVALACAAGGRVFEKAGAGPTWGADEPRRVLLIDGEMPGGQIQRRLAALIAGARYDTGGRLRVLAADLAVDPLPSLSSARGRTLVEEHIGDAELLVFDNVSTLFHGLDENDASEWDPVQEWLLSLRRRGLAALLVHHGGKNGAQRGTSKREDILDTVLSLRLPDDYDESEGCRFRVIFEKARGIAGRDVESFNAQLRMEDGAASWETSDVADELDVEIQKFREGGKSTREIAKKVGLDQSNVARRLKRLRRRQETAP